MLGAIAGDIIGSIYEFRNIKSVEFELFSPKCSFTDDSVLTIALADAIMNNRDYGETMRVSCQGTVPEAMIAFYDSHDFESAIRLAVSLGGDSDTLACITGSIAEAF